MVETKCPKCGKKKASKDPEFEQVTKFDRADVFCTGGHILSVDDFPKHPKVGILTVNVRKKGTWRVLPKGTPVQLSAKRYAIWEELGWVKSGKLPKVRPEVFSSDCADDAIL